MFLGLASGVMDMGTVFEALLQLPVYSPAVYAVAETSWLQPSAITMSTHSQKIKLAGQLHEQFGMERGAKSNYIVRFKKGLQVKQVNTRDT